VECPLFCNHLHTKRRTLFRGNYQSQNAFIKTRVLADVFWHENKNHAENVDLNEFIVMPNHIQGILILNNPMIGNHDNDGNGNDVNVETRHALPQQQTGNNKLQQQRFINYSGAYRLLNKY
jgi:hypothetical protein